MFYQLLPSDIIFNLITRQMQKLWVDNYRPEKLVQLSYHPQISSLLEQLSYKDDFPHIIFYGPDGSGKKTRVMCFLEKLFGNGIYKMKSQTRVFKVQNTSTEIQYNQLESNHHIDITPSNSDRNDRHVINKVIKQSATMANVEKGSKRFRVIIINEADKLTREAQASLRRTMEKHTQTCRLILICEGVHKIISPIRSRCLSMKIKPPTTPDVLAILKQVLSKENCSSIKEQAIRQIAQQSQGNLRKALLSMQLAATIKQSKRPVLQDWKQEIKRAVKTILQDQSQQTYKILEQIFYNLLINCIEEGMILKELLDQLVAPQSKLPDKAIFEIIYRAAETEKNMCQGDKPIYHLLAFAARCVVLIQENK